MLFSELAKVVSGEIIQTGPDDQITTLVIDSRQLTGKKGELFFCIIGPHHNGHRFIKDAYDKGVRHFVVSEPVQLLPDTGVLKVQQATEALQQIAAHHRSQFKYPVIGITGSNGKTMVKEWLSTLLQEKFSVIKSPKSYNSQVGVPLSVWQMSASHDIAVLEAGVSQVDEMQHLFDIIQPDIGIFTNIGEAHSEGFSSLEEKIKEKSLLFAGCEKIVCCKDHKDVYSFLIMQYPLKVISWSDQQSAEVDIRYEDHQVHFNYQNQVYTFRLREQRKHHLENLFHSITAGIICGLNPQEIAAGLRNIVDVPMRLELKTGQNDTYILDDTYNNDLAGLRVALNYQDQQTQFSSKTVILSDILQSGQSEETLYREVNELLVSHQVKRLVGIGPQISKCASIFNPEAYFFEDVESFLKADLTFANEMILVKGARQFGLERVVSFLEEKNHGTVLEVNFEALESNLNTYRSYLKPGTRLMVMVKAFAYGGGIAEISHFLQYHKVDYLGVAYIDEGIYLRKRGIHVPILVMNPEWNSFSLLSSFDLDAEIYSVDMLIKMLGDLSVYPGIHLKIESGMNRLGFTQEDIPQLIKVLQQHPSLKVAGIFTHLSSSESPVDDEFTHSQIKLFNEIYDQLSRAIGYAPIRHVLNSAGIIRWPKYQYEMVRLGIGLYGHDASGQLTVLKPVSTLRSIISQVKKVKQGDSIGYSRKGVASRDGEIAILPIGYADGYLRVFGNGNAHVLVKGKKAKTIGNICMDMTMIDVTGMGLKAGDEAILFGESPSILELASWAGTIPYEILTNVSQRVKRVFRSE